MEITVRKQDLVKELQLIQGIVERKTSIPVLSNVLVEAEGSELRLAATDLDVSLRGRCAAEVKQAGAITLAAKKLYEIVRTLPDADVRMAALKDNWVSIKCERAQFKMAGLPKEDFPALPEAGGKHGVEMPAATLRELISRTSFAITAEEARYYLAGALLVLEDGAAAFVATDGHRLAYAKRALVLDGHDKMRVLVPKKAVNELARLLEDADVVQFQQIDNHLVFAVGDRTLASKTIEGQFPAFEKVVTLKGGNSASVDRVALTAAIRRVSLLSSERSRAIRVKLTAGAIELMASSPDLGEARESVAVEYSGDDVEIGFNAQYLLDFLAAVGTANVVLDLKDADSQGLLKPADDGETEYRYVVMPMRL
jgi:DNA polymerase-3 subunit beta